MRNVYSLNNLPFAVPITYIIDYYWLVLAV